MVEPGPYAVEGVGEEEIPGAWTPDVIDEYLQVSDTDSFAMARRLAAVTGIFGGGSSGMNLQAALEVARGLPEDACVVTVLPDYGKAYLSKVYNEDWLRDWRYLPATPASRATVADLMHAKVAAAWVKPDDTLGWALRQAGEKGYRPLPVLGSPQGPLVGILDERAALAAQVAGLDLENARAGDYLTEAPPVLPADAPWRDAVDALADNEAVLVRTARGWEGLDRGDLMQTLRRLDHSA
jgi:cystathionine beta-synthase